MDNSSDFKKSVGKNLQARRKEAGYKSAKSFAEYIGMETSAYTEYEQGRRSFTYEQAWEFADALNCTLDAIGGRIPPKQSQFSDEKQSYLNNCYENMNDKGKDTLLSVARSMERDTANRIVKDREDNNNQSAIGA